MQESVAVSRHSRWVLAPLLIVITLALAWSGLWLYAKRVAETTIDAWMEREAKVGRMYTCASRTIGGYPFRIEMRCADPAAELRGEGAQVALKARELLAVSQVYRPDLLIAEITGPMMIAESGNVSNFVADWTLMQASVRGLPIAPERISIVLDQPKLRRSNAPGAELLARAEHVEFHVRRSIGAGPGTPAFDLAAQAIGAVIPSVAALAARPLNAEATAVLRGVADLSPKPIATRLREWQAAGGRLEIASARVQQGDALAVARGDLGLSGRGRLEGMVNLTIAGFDEVLRTIGLPSLQGRSQGNLLAGLSSILGGTAELEGKRAATIPLRFNDGAVFLGPLPLGQVPAAY